MKLTIEHMTTEQKLGMLFCARRFKEEDIQYIIELVKKRALGCIQLPAGHPNICERILSEADYPILVFNDAEDGFPTTRLPKIPLMSLAACNNKEYYRAFAKGIVQDAKKAGFNGNWGPVIDVLRCDGPFRVGRHFSDDPERVSEIAAQIAEVYHQNHYLATGKHFPGGEDIAFDTHMTEGFSNVTAEELTEFDLLPYYDLHKKGILPCIMTRHTVFNKIDPDRPASLSKKVIDLIRNAGYDGLIFTDSLAMMGILQKYGEENVYGMAVAAGNDIILPNYRTSVQDAFEMLKQNYYDGGFTEERLNEAVCHVLAAQAFVDEKPENPTVFTEEDRLTLNNVARDCITAITDDGVDVSLSGNDADRLFIIIEDQTDTDGIKSEIYTSKWYYPKKIAEKIRQVFPNSGIEFLPEFSGQKDNERLFVATTSYKEIVFITFCATGCYLGTDCLTRRTEAVINCLIHSNKVSTVLHFGNPYALKPLEHVARKVFGYTIPESQIHAIDVLAGTITAKGTLPFSIDFQ